ncbi:MAG: glycerol-3-phosphate dehydrogenase [Actinomycetota bacterium]
MIHERVSGVKNSRPVFTKRVWRWVFSVSHEGDVEGALAQRISPSTFDIAAQVVFAVVYETARTLSDIVDRRLVLGTVGSVSIDAIRTDANIAGPL